MFSVFFSDRSHYRRDLLLSLILIAFFAMMRVLPHLPNFSPLLAFAFVSGLFLKKSRLAYVLPLAAMLVSDLFLGFYVGMLYTYLGVFVTSIMGLGANKDKMGMGRIATHSFASAAVFFFISNFGVWVSSGFYSLDFWGLTFCFEAALPFFPATLLSNLIYMPVGFYLVKYIEKNGIPYFERVFLYGKNQ